MNFAQDIALHSWHYKVLKNWLLQKVWLLHIKKKLGQGGKGEREDCPIFPFVRILMSDEGKGWIQHRTGSLNIKQILQNGENLSGGVLLTPVLWWNWSFYHFVISFCCLFYDFVIIIVIVSHHHCHHDRHHPRHHHHHPRHLYRHHDYNHHLQLARMIRPLPSIERTIIVSISIENACERISNGWK